MQDLLRTSASSKAMVDTEALAVAFGQTCCEQRAGRKLEVFKGFEWLLSGCLIGSNGFWAVFNGLLAVFKLFLKVF